MDTTTKPRRMALEQDQRISEAVQREESRLRAFIRRRVTDPRDAEDILQDVFYELVEANRMLMPIEHVTGWLFRVARNRIIDLFRKKQSESLTDTAAADADDELPRLEDLLPSPDDGPEALYARSVLLDELELAVDELPEEQREVFVAHELEGRSFKEMAAQTGVGVNTLLSRKRYAVLYLRRLFGGFGGRGGYRSGIGRRMAERCGSMTPEERERFRQRMRERWGSRPPAGESEAQ